MRRNGDTVRYTAAELDEMLRRGESKTDWARVDALTDEEIEASIDWDEEGEFDLDAAFAGLPPMPGADAVDLDADVVAWFKAQGEGYEARINAVLRDFIAAQRQERTPAA